MTIVDKERPTVEVDCDTIDAEIIKQDANVDNKSQPVYYTQGEAYIEAIESANRDPRQRDSTGVRRQILGGNDFVKTPMTLLAERFELTPIGSANDLGMLVFDELEVKS